jgi:hypothetical protein
MAYLHLQIRPHQPRSGLFGQVAQLVEQRTENPRVGGSTPSLATIFFNNLQPLATVAFVFRVFFRVIVAAF